MPASLVPVLCGLLWAGCLLGADYPSQWFLNAHNCYPSHGVGIDRLQRARRAGLSAIELDLVWSPFRARTVINHERKLDGSEPTLDDYFFNPMLPELTRMPAGKPGILLLLDFKTDHPGPVNEVYATLLRHRDLVTTFGDTVRYGPLTVLLTGDHRAIMLYERLNRESEPYLAMGNREPPDSKFRENVSDYFSEPATSFYRVFNFEWIHIERDPNSKAGAFTTAERARLETMVKMAHQKGYWVRTWTLNATSLAWDPSKNFGSREAVLERWRAAREAGIESIATDEYEMAGEFLRQ